MKKLFFAILCALLATSALAQKPAKSLPNEAPKGKRWMACYLEFRNDKEMYPQKTIVAGSWLVDVPADRRSETEEALKEKFLSEYLPIAPSEKPDVGVFKRALCNTFESRGEWAGFVQWIKEGRHFRTDFVPSFSKGFVSSREHIDRQ